MQVRLNWFSEIYPQILDSLLHDDGVVRLLRALRTLRALRSLAKFIWHCEENMKRDYLKDEEGPKM